MSQVKVVNHSYEARLPFLPFHKRTQRFALMVCHRRAGKTHAVLADIVRRALATRTEDAHYAYVAPYYGQAKSVAWELLKKIIREIPGCKVSESELKVYLPNKSMIRLFGADNADAIRGNYFDGIVLDEYGDMASYVFKDVLLPTTAGRNGWFVFIGTPKGKNHFWELREVARTSPKEWFYLELKASESGIITPEEMALQQAVQDEEGYAQEYECSFEAANRGSYYGKLVAALSEKNAIQNFEIDLDEPVCTSWDIGYRDATAIWFWQVIDGVIYVIDYKEMVGKDAEEALDIIDLTPYTYETMWLPHDAKNKTFATKKTVVDTFLEREKPARLVKDIKFSDGIDAVRKTLRTYPIVFHAKNCARGIEALRNYSRKWDADRKVFANTPDHNEWSHGADSFRYFSTVVNPTTIQMSLERGRKRRKQQKTEESSQILGKKGQLTVNIAYTLDDALKDYDRAQARRKSQGMPRI